MSIPGEILHVVMGGGIVLATYRRSDLAHQHARCITGATVASLEREKIPLDLIDCIQVLDRLPPEIVEDVNTEWEGDDEVTPEVTVFNITDLEDK